MLVTAGAGAQRAPAMGSATDSAVVHLAADSLEDQAAARVAAAVCSKRVVVLGELPEHGEARGFAVKARIVERLVARCGFRAVLFEAGSYDFFGFERAIAATPRNSRAAADAGRTDSLDLALARSAASGGCGSSLNGGGGSCRRWSPAVCPSAGSMISRARRRLTQKQRCPDW